MVADDGVQLENEVYQTAAFFKEALSDLELTVSSKSVILPRSCPHVRNVHTKLKASGIYLELQQRAREEWDPAQAGCATRR